MGRKLYLIPLFILLAVTLPHLEQGDFRRDTGRYAAVGLYMWTDGSLLAPYLNPETPYFNKPPLPLLIHGWFLKTFGVHLVTARIPSILAALGVVAFSMMAVRKLGTRAEAVVSGIVLALSYQFFRRTREISLDFWQLFFMMAAVYLVATAIRSNRRGPVILAGIPIGFALLCKPLVAFLVFPIFAAWLFVTQRRSLIVWLCVGALPLSVLVAAPWYVYMYETFGAQFTNQHFGHEVIDRARGLHLKKPFTYYFVETAASYWPWMLGLVYAIYYRIKKYSIQRPARRSLLLLAAIWLVGFLVVLSFFPDKKPNYALPLYPMLSWVVAFGLCRLPWKKLRGWYERGFPRLAPAFGVIFLAAALLPIQFQSPPDKNWVALFKWLGDQNVSVTRIAKTDLDANSLCYVYLETGHWLPSVFHPPKDTNVVRQGDLSLTQFYSAETKGSPLFSSGNLAILSRPEAGK